MYHYTDVTMGAIASQITTLTIVYSTFIQTPIKENIKAPRHWPLCREFTGGRWIPAQMASNAENVSIWWRHHENFGLIWVLLILLVISYSADTFNISMKLDSRCSFLFQGNALGNVVCKMGVVLFVGQCAKATNIPMKTIQITPVIESTIFPNISIQYFIEVIIRDINMCIKHSA